MPECRYGWISRTDVRAKLEQPPRRILRMYKLIMFGEPEACSETTRVGLIHTRDRFHVKSPSRRPYTKGAQIRNGMCSTFSKICFLNGALESTLSNPYRSLPDAQFISSTGSRQTHEKYNEINGLGKINFSIGCRIRRVS